MDREARGMSKFPNVAVEDCIGLDLEDGHGGCPGSAKAARAAGIDIGYAVYFFISVASRSTKSHFCNLPSLVTHANPSSEQFFQPFTKSVPIRDSIHDSRHPLLHSIPFDIHPIFLD
jgi:hypothetical protein